jgi:hypothetical protein
LRRSIIEDPVVSAITTAGYSLAWERWMVIADVRQLIQLIEPVLQHLVLI